VVRSSSFYKGAILEGRTNTPNGSLGIVQVPTLFMGDYNLEDAAKNK
jgi:hypothetical protein